MAKLPPSEIAKVAIGAGLRDRNRLNTAVAVALMESSGETTAHNRIPPDDSYGLWQINMRGDNGPARRRALGIATDAALLDPATNARAMMMISKQGTKWTDWTVFNTGAFRLRLAEADHGVKLALGEVAPADPNNNPAIPDFLEKPAEALGSTASAAVDAARAIGAAGVWMGNRKNWLRVVYVATGGTMLVAALLIASRPARQAVKGAVDKVGGVAMMAVPGGGAAKAATKAAGAAKAAKAA